MTKRLTLLALAAALLLPALSFAQYNEAGIRKIEFDTLVRGQVEPLPVGVDQMRYIGTEYIGADDSSIMQWATNIVQSDIDFYANFELIPLDTFYLKVYEITDLNLLGWSRLGAESLVKLEAEFPGTNVRIWWRLYDVVHGQEIAKGQVEYHRAYWRELAHDVANEVVHQLTGDPGIFRTKIAYIKKLENNVKEVFVADYDGANERQLTHTESTNLSPAFSADGQSIYFTSFINGSAQLFRIGIDGGKMETIAAFEGINAAPVVSPDGQKVACVLSRDGNSEIYVLGADGRVVKRLTNHRAIDTAPTWSPDGDRIVFASDRTGAPQLYVMDDDGLATRRLTYRGSYNDSPDWSGRNDRIVFVSRDKWGRFNIASVDTAGREYRLLTDIGTNENPHFAPDGRHVIFSSTRLGGRDLYTMDTGGRKQRRLTHSNNCTNPVWGPLPR